MKPSEILHKAQQLLISKPGGKAWCKRIKGGGSGPYCAMGGVYHVNGVDPWSPMLRTYLNRSMLRTYLNRSLPFGSSVESFNDDPDTTLWDIVVLFRKAINLAKSEGK